MKAHIVFGIYAINIEGEAEQVKPELDRFYGMVQAILLTSKINEQNDTRGH